MKSAQGFYPGTLDTKESDISQIICATSYFMARFSLNGLADVADGQIPLVLSARLPRNMLQTPGPYPSISTFTIYAIAKSSAKGTIKT
jgi:hypothetical protein